MQFKSFPGRCHETLSADSDTKQLLTQQVETEII